MLRRRFLASLAALVAAPCAKPPQSEVIGQQLYGMAPGGPYRGLTFHGKPIVWDEPIERVIFQNRKRLGTLQTIDSPVTRTRLKDA